MSRYVDQYQALLAAPSGLEGIEEADLEYYEAVVASSSGCDLDEPYLPPQTTTALENEWEDEEVDGHDGATTAHTGVSTWELERHQQYLKEKTELEELYAGYVDKPGRLEKNLSSAGGGVRGGNSLAEPYERWLRGFEV